MLWAGLHASSRDARALGESDEASCHASTFASFERSSEGGETRLRVPPDRNPLEKGVEVVAITSSGSASSSTLVTLRDAQHARDVEAKFEVAFDRMLSRHPLPEALRGIGGDPWRRMVEEAAFGTVCSRADPSLERLLTPDAPLHWVSGEPRMPQSYAVFVAHPEKGDPYWVEYLGANHRRLTADALGDKLEVVDRKGPLQLLRSGHGAVVQDLERRRYAWVYVFPGGRKLRWPSVKGGELGDGSVTLIVDPTEAGEGGERIRIDLESGAAAPDS